MNKYIFMEQQPSITAPSHRLSYYILDILIHRSTNIKYKDISNQTPLMRLEELASQTKWKWKPFRIDESKDIAEMSSSQTAQWKNQLFLSRTFSLTILGSNKEEV